MTPKFTTPAFIRRNDPELRKKLEDLGYKTLFSARHGYGDGLCAWYGHVDGCQVPFKRIAGIDCGDNEQLFLALAAMREDSDYMQWFTTHDYSEWVLSDTEICFVKIDSTRLWHKATSTELIEHFKEK